MSIRIALAGNPNSGKTTLFNVLTGSNQYVGNWPGVTVEKKEGTLKKNDDVIITDLPGIYSLSPYTPEEVVARNYLVGERPDVILNVVDGTNIERNLYLTTQLLELGIPTVIAINMMDIVRKNGDKIDISQLSKNIRCTVMEISALKNEGITEVIDAAIEIAGKNVVPEHIFSGDVEHAVAHIEEAAIHNMEDSQQRWYAIKIFERDVMVRKELPIDEKTLAHIEKDIAHVEEHFDDDAESIIINERYEYIEKILKDCSKKKSLGRLTVSDKIDRIVTNRFLALPIFAIAMWLVYYISIGSVGNWTVEFMNERVFGEWIVPFVENGLKNLGCMEWLISLVSDGILGGVGAVLGFVPQMLILFLILSLLEDCGYMSRVAFIMDKIFRKFGLSGKSFIPMLVASGCGVPGIMASRTIEQDRDRRITIMTTGFIPCGAKMPIVGLVAASLFGGSALMAASAYFMGIGAVLLSGIMLKKTKLFAGKPAPFVMELPLYHAPLISNVARTVWERGWSFIKKAGTVILAASVIIWFLNNLSFTGGLHFVTGENEVSVLNVIGNLAAVIFKPLGFGNWQASIATFLGLMAKEEIVGVFGALGYSTAEAAFASVLGGKLAGFSFMAFNLLCAPCFAAMGAIRREMNSPKWTVGAIAYMCVFAYGVSLMIYQFGSWFTGKGNIIGTVVAVAVLIFALYMLIRKNKYN
ncbi:MAG: ferrous iron transport protein B [Acutalibacteraceae bacterium]|nr:ferrous iron transport protein B [Acutalibacteraceae bacterium]